MRYQTEGADEFVNSETHQGSIAYSPGEIVRTRIRFHQDKCFSNLGAFTKIPCQRFRVAPHKRFEVNDRFLPACLELKFLPRLDPHICSSKTVFSLIGRIC